MSLIFKFDKKYPTIVRYVLEKRGWKSAEPTGNWHLYWRSSRFSMEEVNNAMAHQKFNHFVNSGVITRKAGISYHLKQQRKKYGPIYDIMPPSFVYTQESRDVLHHQLNKLGILNKTWILKPSSGSQGRGIQIVKNLRNAVIPETDASKLYTVQMYINNPMLIMGYKFDIRIYALVTSFHPMKIFLYKEGLVRFATEKYDDAINENPSDNFKHLTNTSINKFSPIFNSGRSTFESDITQVLGFGSKSKRTLKQLVAYFYRNNVDFRPIWDHIKKIVMLSLLPLGPYVPKSNAQCFEIYGFDVILDNALTPWLLEVNFSPSLSCDCNVDQTVKEGLIEDVIDILGFDPVSTYRDSDAVTREKVQDFHKFMNRSSGNGNFELIFPFNEETKEASKLMCEHLDVDEQEAIIVKNIEKKFGAEYVPPRFSRLP